MPRQYEAYRLGHIRLGVQEVLLDRVRDAIRPYASACKHSN
jgi:tagatose-1,6-bisphosphate aldolase non-catalytic subunit AgaZ/GatZ